MPLSSLWEPVHPSARLLPHSLLALFFLVFDYSPVRITKRQFVDTSVIELLNTSSAIRTCSEKQLDSNWLSESMSMCSTKLETSGESDYEAMSVLQLKAIVLQRLLMIAWHVRRPWGTTIGKIYFLHVRKSFRSSG